MKKASVPSLIIKPVLGILFVVVHASFAFGGGCPRCAEQSVALITERDDSIVCHGRSMLLDYLRVDATDSIKAVQEYLDSLYSPDSSWLQPKERFYFRLLRGDSSVMYNVSLLCMLFDLYDTSKEINAVTLCNGRASRIGLSPCIGSDNMLMVLEKTLGARLAKLQKIFPQFADALEFNAILVRKTVVGRNKVNDLLEPFRSHFPRSPLACLRYKDWHYWDWVQEKDQAKRVKLGFFIGKIYTSGQGKQKTGIPDVVYGSMIIDFLYRNYNLSTGVSFGGFHSLKMTIHATDTVNAGVPLNSTVFFIETGIAKTLPVKTRLVPFVGVLSFHATSDSDYIKKTGLKKEIPLHFGPKVGLMVDHFFGNFGLDGDNMWGGVRIKIEIAFLNLFPSSRLSDNLVFNFGVLFGIHQEKKARNIQL